jgi:hypothetical protein
MSPGNVCLALLWRLCSLKNYPKVFYGRAVSSSLNQTTRLDECVSGLEVYETSPLSIHPLPLVKPKVIQYKHHVRFLLLPKRVVTHKCLGMVRWGLNSVLKAHIAFPLPEVAKLFQPFLKSERRCVMESWSGADRSN